MVRTVRPLIDNRDGTLTVQLTRGMAAIVDAADGPRVSVCNWQAFVSPRNPTPYAAGQVNGKKVFLHRYLLDFPPTKVDHQDGDGLNNRRENLRACTVSQNGMNTRRIRGSVQLKGVDVSEGRYRAKITISGRSRFLGRFPTAIEAAIAYDAAALEHFGRFAATNATLGLLPTEATQ